MKMQKLWHFTSTEAMQLIDQIAAQYQLNFRRQHGHITLRWILVIWLG